jgi:FkbM family methyltransferase
MFVSNLLGRARVDGFSSLLLRCERIDPSTKVFVDGGAGTGETAAKLLAATPGNSGPVVAFEPNPDNVSRFSVAHPRLMLVAEALSDENGTAEFMVTSKTQRAEDSRNQFMQAGTSFVGKLALEGDRPASAEYYPVRVRRMQDALAGLGLDRADFIKLDLQGAESHALRGLGDLVSTVKWMWIEFSNQPGLLSYLADHGFVLFDTAYLFVGQPNELIEELFTIGHQGTNSIGKQIFFGRRRHVWRDYERAFTFARTKRRMIQTDMVAVAPHYLPVFLEAAIDLIDDGPDRIRWQVPRGLF